MFFTQKQSHKSKNNQQVTVIQENDPETDTNSLQLIIRLKQLENHQISQNQINQKQSSSLEKGQLEQESTLISGQKEEIKPHTPVQNAILNSSNTTNQIDIALLQPSDTTQALPQKILQPDPNTQEVQKEEVQAKVNPQQFHHIDFFGDLIPLLKQHYVLNANHSTQLTNQDKQEGGQPHLALDMQDQSGIQEKLVEVSGSGCEDIRLMANNVPSSQQNHFESNNDKNNIRTDQITHNNQDKQPEIPNNQSNLNICQPNLQILPNTPNQQFVSSPKNVQNIQNIENQPETSQDKDPSLSKGQIISRTAHFDSSTKAGLSASMNGRSSASPPMNKKTPDKKINVQRREITAHMEKTISLMNESTLLRNRKQVYCDSQQQVLVSYKIMWIDGSTEISDQFLWPKSQKDIKVMKMFAIDFLSDTLGRTQLSQTNSFHVVAFANFVCYVINREIDLSDHLDEYSVESMVKDGHFGNQGMGYGEHIVHLNLKFKDMQETIEWDICNPDNQPEEFARVLIQDMKLAPQEEYLIAITYEIRKQIKYHICKRIQSFTNFFENYGQNELDIIEFNKSKGFQSYEEAGSHNIHPSIQYASSTLFLSQSKENDEFSMKDFINSSKTVDELEIFMNNQNFSDQLFKPTIDMSQHLKHKKSKFVNVPEFVKMSVIQDIQKEEKALDDYVYMANIVLTNEAFFPKPPDPLAAPLEVIQPASKPDEMPEDQIDEGFKYNQDQIDHEQKVHDSNEIENHQENIISDQDQQCNADIENHSQNGSQQVNGYHEATFQEHKNSQESIYHTNYNKPSQSAPKLTLEGNSQEIQHKVAQNGKIVFTKNVEQNKRSQKMHQKEFQSGSNSIQKEEFQYDQNDLSAQKNQKFEDIDELSRSQHSQRSFQKPVLTLNENIINLKKKESTERHIRYTEGRAQIKIKKKSDLENTSQNAITLGFGTQSPSPQKNHLGFKDLDDENLDNELENGLDLDQSKQENLIENQKVCLEIDEKQIKSKEKNLDHLSENGQILSNQEDQKPYKKLGFDEEVTNQIDNDEQNNI